MNDLSEILSMFIADAKQLHPLDVRIHYSRLSESLLLSRLVEWILIDSSESIIIEVIFIIFFYQVHHIPIDIDELRVNMFS